MKKFITLLVMMIAFTMNAVAYEKGKLIERHIFRLMTPDERGATDYTYDWDDTDCWGNVRILKSITLSGSQKQTYLSWLDGSKRFIVMDYTQWGIGTNDRPDLGVGLMNNSTEYQDFFIENLKQGDKILIEYYKNGPYDQDEPKFVNDNIVGSSANSTFYGTREYEVNSNGMVQISCPPRLLICSVTITHANYQKADYSIDPVTDEDGNTGYEFTITGTGVLEEKHPAIPYLTMAFGNDEDMTVVRNMNGNYAASSIIDPSHDLDITHDDVMISHNYKKRYQNSEGKYVRQNSNWWSMGDDYADNNYIASDEDEVKQMAIDEVNRLKGQEWTMFRTDGYNWEENLNWRLEGRRAYKWNDDFHSIWPLYGTYFYFFPEVRGKLSIKFYCEGNHQSMPFWWKAQDGEIVDEFRFGGDSDDSNIYEYNDIEVVAGGAYYLCANPTLIEKQHPVVRLISFKFIPSFSVQPLYKVVDNGTTSVNHACTIKGGPFSDLTVDKTNGKLMINGEEAAQVKFEGNIYDAEFAIENGSGDEQYLNITNIKFKDKDNPSNTKVNKGGAIIVNLFCKASGDTEATDINKATFVLTVAYSAEPAVWNEDGTERVRDPQGTGMAVKKWDFYTNELAVGQYKNGSGTYPSTDWTNSSTLYKEVNKFDGMTTDWVNTFADAENSGKEPIFKSVYDMEGDNADMLKETAGLVFLTETNLLGIYNENDASGDMTARDRYIGLMGTLDWDMTDHHRKLIIPFLKAGDRVVMKLGTYGNVDSEVTTKTATLKMTNALDAVGNEITGDYVIGGSGIAKGNDTNGGVDITDKSKPWGEYHFIVKANGTNLDNDFALEVKDAKLLKIYSIVIYRNAKDNNADILTENELLGDEEHRQILNTQDFTTAADNVQLHMHYRGLNEGTNYGRAIAKTGNLQNTDISFTSATSNTLWYTCSVGGYVDNVTAEPSFTPDKAKFGVFKARLGVQTLGTGVHYVTDYADCMIPVGYRETKQYPYTWDLTDLKKYVSASINANGIETEVADADADLRIWDEWNLRVKPEEWDGNIFASGGQLYGGKTMIDETRGLGITHDNNNVASITGTTTDETGSLAVGDGAYGFIVPRVDKNEAIYVRAHKTGGEGTPDPTYEESNGENNYVYGQAAQEFPYHETVDDGTDDEVFALVMPSDLEVKHDVRLNFKGYEVKKIAVSTDAKKVNTKGYASESRDHAIDASLLPYFTGKEMKTLVVSDVDYNTRTLTLTDVGAETKYVLPEDAENGVGCVIFNKTDENKLDLFGTDTGFHLFVPDMHDKTGKDYDGENLLTAQLTGTTLGMFTGDNTNYVLSYKWYNLKPDGTPTGQLQESEELFYRVSNSGITLRDNSAYLQLPTEKVKPSTTNPTGHAKFTFRFSWEDLPVPTAIEEANVIEMLDGTNYVWHNLNGQKLNGKPSTKGLYIVNGKKVMVK